MNRVKGVINQTGIMALVSPGSVTVAGGESQAPVWGVLPFGLYAFSAWVDGEGGGGTVSAVKGKLTSTRVVGVLS